VGDNEHRIAQVLDLALDRADLIIVTGGLGPTVDDVTREAVSRVTGRELVLYPDLLAQIDDFFAQFGRKMSENNRRQAYLPQDCIPIENPVGTAPAFIVEDHRGTIITLPGVPREMRYLMEHAVMPYLLKHLGQQDVMVTRILRTVAVGESRIDQAIADLETSANPTVGLSAHPGQTDVRIVAKAPSQAEAEELVAGFEAEIRKRLGAAIYGTGKATLEEVIAALLRDQGATLAAVETLTLGDVSQRMGAHPDVFRGGIVAANDESLSHLLSLDAASLTGQDGAIALADGVRQTLGASCGLAVSGEGEEWPWIAVVHKGGTDTRRLRWRGKDRRARVWTTSMALEFVRRLLLGLADGWAD
jgi:competence/damage-inducible protein CinA-like protein